jgi:putative ABC transport system permease protein
MGWQDLIANATESLTRNKSRSLLTILGIVIGVAAVILMLSIGRGAEGYILSQVSDLGSDLLFIEPSAGGSAAGPPDPFVEQSLGRDDVDVLEESGIFDVVAPVLISTQTVSRLDQSEFSQIVGVTEDHSEVFTVDVEEGRDLNESDIESFAKVAVLGNGTAQDFFGDQDPIGKKIKIGKTPFRVIGVFEEQGSRFFQNLDQRVTIPVSTMQQSILGVDHVTYIAGRVAPGTDIEVAKEEASYIIRTEHDIDDPEDDDFIVSSQSDAVDIVGTVGDVLSLLLAAIAAISLLVGGIGIMNIMLVSVTERTREIGLRKAVGATEENILRQFLLEAVTLTVFGGLVGVVFGVLSSWLTAFVVRQFLAGWAFVIPVSTVLISFVVAVTVGLVFGIYPARRAAQLDPIDALRHE